MSCVVTGGLAPKYIGFSSLLIVHFKFIFIIIRSLDSVSCCRVYVGIPLSFLVQKPHIICRCQQQYFSGSFKQEAVPQHLALNQETSSCPLSPKRLLHFHHPRRVVLKSSALDRAFLSGQPSGAQRKGSTKTQHDPCSILSSNQGLPFTSQRELITGSPPLAAGRPLLLQRRNLGPRMVICQGKGRFWREPHLGFMLRTLLIGCKTPAQPLRPSGSSSIPWAQSLGQPSLMHCPGDHCRCVYPLQWQSRDGNPDLPIPSLGCKSA